MPAGDACVVFAKWPAPGAVKTRLAAGSSAELATAFYRLCCRGLASQCSSHAGEWRCVLAVSPPGTEPLFRAWLQDCCAQGLQLTLQLAVPDLGARMHAAIAGQLAAGARKVVLVGSDIPDLSAAVVRAAFRALDTAEVVLGPARDGGFYLIGATRLPEAALQGIRWSTATVLAATVARCEALGMRVDAASLPTLRDIDTFEAGLCDALVRRCEGSPERPRAVAQDLRAWAAGADEGHELRAAVRGLIDGCAAAQCPG